MATDRRFAVLIDADNVSDKYIKIILDEISNDGEVTYKRIYGDWTKPALAPWKKVLLEHSVTPIQQYSYTTGKNATDSAMIIDAMDILYSGSVEGFCLVSSDSDFTRLASRLRESGMMVVGMGEQKTPKPFITACNKFKYLDILAGEGKKHKAKAAAKAEKAEKADKPEKAQDKAEKTADKKALPAPKAKVKNLPQVKSEPVPENLSDAEIEEKEENEITSLEEITEALHAILAEESDEDGWVSTSDLGSRLVKRYSDFDVRNYGFPKLTPFLKSLRGFEMRTVRNENSSIKMVYLREYIPDREQQ